MLGMSTFASDGTELTSPAVPEPPVVEPDAAVVVEPEVVESDSLAVVRDDDDAIHDAEVVVADDEPAADEKWVHQSEWKYDWLDYKGDKLAIRVPHQNALTALFQAGQQCSPEFQADLTQKFVKRHISQESIERVLERMSDPDDEEYAAVEIGVWGDLLRIIAKIGGDRATRDAEALLAVQSGKTKA
ncbi:hypothetical protein BTO20_06070 [Mycobacterium dioxanotrophicus]|jgi:hypothetical protein|uniref:Tail assembly chaperone n=2 Tax=Mycobacterium dioxanotrophicus TaxID=482462 RepID=A0A1Y0BZA9_9MYCO|nr:hypothetical protein BTO20_06070 [Mycobacterium dioxanotrophicus]